MTGQGRKYQVVHKVREQYKTRVALECPFCHFIFPAFVAALNYMGKRCINKQCRAHHKSDGKAYLP